MFLRFLLYGGIIGFACWIASEVLEIFQGEYSPAVYYLTSVFHFFAGLGIWGLHKVQTPELNIFNWVGAVLASLSYIGLTFFPLQVMETGLTVAEFMEVYPVYKGLGLVWFVGMLLFGIAVIVTRFFPVWIGVIIIVGTIIFTSAPIIGLPQLILNCSNIIFSAVMIYACFLGLNDPELRFKE